MLLLSIARMEDTRDCISTRLRPNTLPKMQPPSHDYPRMSVISLDPCQPTMCSFASCLKSGHSTCGVRRFSEAPIHDQALRGHDVECCPRDRCSGIRVTKRRHSTQRPSYKGLCPGSPVRHGSSALGRGFAPPSFGGFTFFGSALLHLYFFTVVLRQASRCSCRLTRWSSRVSEMADARNRLSTSSYRASTVMILECCTRLTSGNDSRHGAKPIVWAAPLSVLPQPREH